MIGAMDLYPAIDLRGGQCVRLYQGDFAQETVYGELMSSAPRLAPSSLNCTPATATSSVAVAVTATVPETVEPPAGAVMATLGG